MTQSLHATGWIAFHVFLPSGHNRFLVDVVHPLLHRPDVAPDVRRFFFIRYSEGGHHLRLRLLPQPGTAVRLAGAVHAALVAGLPKPPTPTGSTDAAGGVPFPDQTGSNERAAPPRVVRATYDRTAHYFGPTWASVYAELLNEQTSILALRLLQRNGDTPAQRFLWLTALADEFVHRAAPASEGPASPARLRTDWLRFAEAACRTHFGEESNPPDPQAMRPAAAVLERTRSALRTRLANDPTVLRIARLLRRLRGHPDPNRRFVAVHALHLLFNKMGYALPRERFAVRVLCTCAGEPLTVTPTPNAPLTTLSSAISPAP